ncbi:MAG TPA: hypothetical protein VFM43_09070 [Gaiellaceae bacterium]|nr:hypothetical protein [Gaiellaceae bacterium]
MALAATKAHQKKAAKGAKSRLRRSLDASPEYLPGATAFSDDPELTDAYSLVKLVKKHLSGGQAGTVGDLWDRMAPTLDLSKPGGRPRKPGSWGLAYIGYVMSRSAELYGFWNNQLSKPLWVEAGFEGRRPYPTAWRRFGELEAEACIEAFEDGADELLQLAMSKEPRIGREVYIDATAVHSRARLHHDCPDKKACKAAGRTKQTLDSASPEEVKSAREEEAKKPAPKKLRHPDAARSSKPEEGDKYPHYVWVGDHRYGVLDTDVGVRAYKSKSGKTKKFWPGAYDMVAVDGFTGGSLRNLLAPANKMEHNLWAPLMLQTIHSMGGVVPELAAGDRGHSVEHVFRWNAEHGIISALPFRQPHQSVERHDMRCLAFDEHGVGRCPNCGGPGDQLPGFTFTSHGYPRVRFRCASPNTVACMTETWELNPAEHKNGWRSLIGISRLSGRYQAARNTQQHHERTFRDRRKRYYVDGADETGKIKRFGLAAHRLRTAVARFMEWFRICLWNGYLPGYQGKQNTLVPKLRSPRDRIRTTRNVRRWQGLDLPYGPQAFALGLAPDDKVPPWRPPPEKNKAEVAPDDPDDD